MDECWGEALEEEESFDWPLSETPIDLLERLSTACFHSVVPKKEFK